ncbi:MAG: TraM recognition domain-containing protein [Bacteroidetes bacterium]|nr:TraM recognition domain-containing protein [Bacteroidota bacterium]
MQQFSLDNPLLELPTPAGLCQLTLRHLCESIAIFGGIGSGKTSGSGAVLSKKLLQNRYGGLVLTVKPDERAMWEEYCRQTNRTNDLIIVEPNGKYFFDMLDFEIKKSKSHSNISDNITEVLNVVLSASEEKASGKPDDPFWQESRALLLTHIIDLCLLAYNKVTVSDIFEIMKSLPKSSDAERQDAKEKDKKDDLEENTKEKNKPTLTAFENAFSAAIKNAEAELDVWKETLPSDELVSLVESGRFDTEAENKIPAARLIKQLDHFFNEQYYSLSEKTSSIINFSLSSFLFRLMREPVHSVFCKTASNFSPDDCLDGKIILLDFPVKTYNKTGQEIQMMFKYIWQRAMEKRDITKNDRPVFLLADGAQTFFTLKRYDVSGNFTSARTITVYLSQNLHGYYAAMGGAKSEHRVKAFLGTLGTKIFHANADIETNQYASSLIGEAEVEVKSTSDSSGQTFSHSETRSGGFQKLLRPEMMMRLRTGGPSNGFLVDGVVHYQGRLLMKSGGFAIVAFL